MKKIVLAFAIMFTLLSCSNEDEIIVDQPETEVEVSLDYSFVETGYMTRSGSDVYMDFYNKYIKTKLLTPTKFILTFTNKETGAVAKIGGYWNKRHMVKLLTGEYEVTGTSVPSSSMCLDTAYLYFDENIIIDNETQEINLTAKYDSYLLMFDKSDKRMVDYKYGSGYTTDSPSSISLKNVDDIYYAFFNKLLANENSIEINRGVISTISLDDIPFEKGKYYYFNDVSGSFDIPPMESGN